MSGYVGLRRFLGQFLGQSHQGQRDVYDSFGYPKIFRDDDLMAMYYRNDIASRIIRAFPAATWRHYPDITDDSDEDNLSDFCEAWLELAEKHRVYSYLERADRLSGIGQFALLHMGFNDGKREDTPLEEGNAPLIYLKPYSQSNVSVTQWDMDTQSPRYGLPEVFTVQQGNSSTNRERTPSMSINVHWTRCIHISEFLEDDEFYGTPRLESVYNRLKDLEKVVGASAETYFQNSKKPISFEAADDSQIADTDEAKSALQTQMDDFYHNLRPYLALQGLKANVLDTRVEDPSGIIDKLLDLIAGAIGIPKRILIGSERGELSSAQDENNWSARIDERRRNFAAPFILRPFIDALIKTGNLPQPEGAYYVDWDQGSTLGEQEKAQIGLQKAQALQVYANTPAADSYVTPQEFRTWVNLDPDDMPEIEELPEIPSELDLPFKEIDLERLPQQKTEDSIDPQSSLNGAQVTSLVAVIKDVVLGMLPRESAIEIIISSFPIDRDQADRILGDVGKGFEPSQDEKTFTNKIKRILKIHTETFTPPKGVQDNAQKVLDWRDEHGDDVKGMTQTGWTRANQLAKGEAVSVETIKRMVSFFARHDGNQDIAEEFKGEPWRDAGYVSWLGWGGDAGRSWAERVSMSLEE